MLTARFVNGKYIFNYRGNEFTTPPRRDMDRFVNYMINSYLVEPGRYK